MKVKRFSFRGRSTHCRKFHCCARRPPRGARQSCCHLSFTPPCVYGPLWSRAAITSARESNGSTLNHCRMLTLVHCGGRKTISGDEVQSSTRVGLEVDRCNHLRTFDMLIKPGPRFERGAHHRWDPRIGRLGETARYGVAARRAGTDSAQSAGVQTHAASMTTVVDTRLWTRYLRIPGDPIRRGSGEDHSSDSWLDVNRSRGVLVDRV